MAVWLSNGCEYGTGSAGGNSSSLESSLRYSPFITGLTKEKQRLPLFTTSCWAVTLTL